MIPVHHWARDFEIEKSDFEFLTSLLLEREQPLTTEALAHALIEERLAKETAALRDHYKNTRIYNPAQTYRPGEHVIFPALDYATATIVQVRPGNNPEYQTFNVMGVQFNDDSSGETREFAFDMATPHILSEQDTAALSEALLAGDVGADEIIAEHGDDIIYALEQSLQQAGTLIQVAGAWFPRDLMVEVNEGHLNLAEAVIDIHGHPLSTETIVEQIGSLGSGSAELQMFSMNDALRGDERFDEVGPAGKVLWYLLRLEAPEVRTTPAMLRYTPIEYDASLLTPELVALEAELDDEMSPASSRQETVQQATITLTYPHRRTGTLPLNSRLRQIFPTARQTQRVSAILVDGQDGEAYDVWVVRKERYVVGVDRFFRKHRLPIGAHVTVAKEDATDRVIINFNAYRPRTEWIRLIVPKNGQIAFENHKRSIGAEYDDLMILGADDLAGVDALFDQAAQKKTPLATLLRTIIPGLGRLTPQGTVHAKTIYSAVNVIRRCPPGPIFATLCANPEFMNVGGHYWKMRDS